MDYREPELFTIDGKEIDLHMSDWYDGPREYITQPFDEKNAPTVMLWYDDVDGVEHWFRILPDSSEKIDSLVENQLSRRELMEHSDISLCKLVGVNFTTIRPLSLHDKSIEFPDDK